MKTTRKVSLLLCLLIYPLLTMAQEPDGIDGMSVTSNTSNAERRMIISAALTTLEEYELHAKVQDKWTQNSFKSLFVPDATIYSDLLDYAPGTQIPLNEYIHQLQQKNNVKINLKNVTKNNLEWIGDAWHLKLSMDKSISYMDDNGILFSSDEYYGNHYLVTFDFVYNPADSTCLIASISGSVKSETPHLPDNFVVINYTPEYDRYRNPDERALHFNSFDQALTATLPSTIHHDVRLKTNTITTSEKYSMVDLDYKITCWRLKLRAAYAFPIKNSVQVYNDYYDTENHVTKLSSYETGVDIGLSGRIGKTGNISLYTGIALNQTSLSMQVNQMEYSYQLHDNNGLLYERKYSLQKISEAVTYTELVVPVYLSLDHTLAKNVFLHWSAGVKLYPYPISFERTPFHVIGSVNSIYKSEELNKSHSFNQDHTTFLFPVDYKLSKLPWSLTGGLTISCNLYKHNIYLYAKGEYEKGQSLFHELDAKEDYFTSYPFVYSGFLDKDIVTKSLIASSSFSTQYIWSELGLMFKF